MVLWGEGEGEDEGDPSHVPPPVKDVVLMDIGVQIVMPWVVQERGGFRTALSVGKQQNTHQ